MKNYNVFSKTILIIFFVCITLAITSFFYTLKDSKVYLDFSNTAITDFYNHYQVTILLLGVGITLITLWATFVRMIQTENQLSFLEQQIKSINEQNKFSNFYTHREEFIKSFSDHYFIKEISKVNEIVPRILLNDIYSSMYYETHKEFSPHLNKTFNTEVEEYFNAVENSILNHNTTSLKSINYSEIDIIRQKIPPKILIYIYRFSLHIQLSILNPNRQKILDQEDIKVINSLEFVRLHEIFFSIKLLNLLLTYDGITRNPYNYFWENILSYRIELHLPFDIYKEF